MTERTCNLQCVTYDDMIQRHEREIQVLMWYTRTMEIIHDEGSASSSDHIDRLLDEFANVRGGTE